VVAMVWRTHRILALGLALGSLATPVVRNNPL
jgi:hypothetical protein